MFTGLIEEIGKIEGIHKTRVGILLKVISSIVSSDVKPGDSIAVDGVCLSVTEARKHTLCFDVMQETLSRTTLTGLKAGNAVNLERSLRADSRLGGHFVSGHIDYKGSIVGILKGSKGEGFKVSLPREFSKFVVEKGSVALDGVSLTVAAVEKENFTVYLIPHTLKNTTFSRKKRGDAVNIETDLLAKYIAARPQKPSLEKILKKYNYI
ncbi:MAG: riboflavin synthase [Candidatus Omnitrophica bacterium]|nr:riboflavin synthase [Candidatus Omnitrophota bacterium]